MAIHVLVEVKLKEKDRGTPDVPIGVVVKLEGAAEKVLGRASTGSDGVAVVELTSAVSPRELLALPRATAYAVAYDKKGKIAAKSKSISLRTAHPTLRIDADSDVALNAGWLRSKEARPTAERVERRLREWEKANRSNPEPPVDVCLTRTLLDTLAGLHAPKSEFQKDVARRLHLQLAAPAARGSRRLTTLADGRRPPKLDDKTLKIIKDLSAKAAQARDSISDFGLTATGTCDASGTAEGIAGNLFHSSPRFSQIMQALCDQDAPFVEEGLPQKAGEPWLTEFEWNTKCVELYGLGNLRAPIANMMRPYEDPTTHQLATPKSIEVPRVKVVEVRDPIRRKIVRSTSDISSGVIRATNFTGTEWNTEDWDMRVPLDDQRCVVKKAANPSAPAAAQRQITVFDIVPGQTILIKGSGFITEKATVVLKRQEWALDADEGRLVPQGPELPTVLAEDTVLVKGNTFPHQSWTADTYVGDAIVFEWPSEVTAEGLYTLSFQFENLKDAQGLPYVAQSVQSSTCEFARPEVLETPALHFALLKAVAAPVLREPSLARVTCIDETNPELPWFDSVSLLTDTTIERLLFDVSDPAQCRPLPTEQLHNTRGPEILDFWDDGDVQDPMMRLLPDSDATRALQLDELMAVLVSGDELFDPTARLILKIALSAVLIAIMLLVTALIVTLVVAIGFAVLIGYLVVAAIVTTVTAGVAGAAFAAAAAVTGSLFVFLGPVVVALWAGVLIGGISAINLFVDHIDGARSMFRMGMSVHGMELALKRSPYRFHQRLWPVGRSQESTSDMALVDSSITPEEFKETYGAQPLGGDYRIELKMPFQR